MLEDEADDGMIWEKKLVGRPKGTDYSQSRKGNPGDKSPLLRSEGDSSLDTQAIIRDLDDEDGEEDEGDGEGGDSINPLVVLGLIAAGVVGIFAYLRFVKPKVDEYRAAKRARKETAAAAASAEFASAPSQTTEVSKSVGDEVEVSGATIDSEQWYALFFEALTHGAAGSVHAAISVEKWQMLARARVAGDEETQALARAMQKLTPEEFKARVDLVLEQHPELLDDPSSIIDKLRSEVGDALPMAIPVSRNDDQPGTLVVEEPPRTFDNETEAPGDPEPNR